MRLSLVQSSTSNPCAVVSTDGDHWYRVRDLFPGNTVDLIELLAHENDHPGWFDDAIANQKTSLSPLNLDTVKGLLPFHPAAYRDFMLYEDHAVNAQRGFLKKYLPDLYETIARQEQETGEIHPNLKPAARWYTYPIYYLGNHLNFATDGDEIQIPEYTHELDYELEIGVIICKPLKNATPEEARKAIGGFVVLNDFTARDIQLDEMGAGFGPMKSKNFINSISTTIVSADEILPIIDNLHVQVKINNETIAQNTTSGMYHSIPQAISYASWEEQLHPGELFGTGTIPACTGIENGFFLTPGDTIKLEVEKIGILENQIV